MIGSKIEVMQGAQKKISTEKGERNCVYYVWYMDKVFF